MTRGRKPKPTRLKILHGSTEPINEHEPQFAPEVPDAPAFLPAEAKREWDRVAALLSEARVLTQADRGVLTAYCRAWAMLDRAERETKRGGIMKKGKTNGGEYINHWWAVGNRAAADLVRYGALLGLDPSSRSRIDVDMSSGKPTDGYDAERARVAAKRNGAI